MDGREGILAGMRHALDHLGLAWPGPDASRLIGPPLQDVLSDAFGLSEGAAKEALRVYREYYVDRGITQARVYPGIPDLLAGLEAVLAVATAKPHVYAERMLQHFDLRKYFAFVAGPELDGTRRRKIELIQHALAHLPCPRAEETVMIGDRRYDVEGARAAGVTAISIGWGFGSPQELKDSGADYHAASVQDLRELLATL